MANKPVLPYFLLFWQSTAAWKGKVGGMTVVSAAWGSHKLCMTFSSPSAISEHLSFTFSTLTFTMSLILILPGVPRPQQPGPVPSALPAEPLGLRLRPQADVQPEQGLRLRLPGAPRRVLLRGGLRLQANPRPQEQGLAVRQAGVGGRVPAAQRHMVRGLVIRLIENNFVLRRRQFDCSVGEKKHFFESH